MRGVRRWLRASCAAWLGLLAVWVARTPLGAQDVAPEYRLKAAFVSHFPQFVGWPPQSLGVDRPVEICVLSPNPFGHVLEQLVDGAAVAAHPLVVRSVDASGRIDTCHVLFLPDKAPGRDVLLHRALGSPILTVGDDARFLDAGGIIELRVVASRVRFDVSLPAARAAGLHLSAQLLRLASHVRGGAQ